MSWSFTPDEFAHIWRETDLDRYPFPLRVLETPGTEHEARSLRAQLEARMPLGQDADLTACLRILAAPRTRVALIGGPHTPGDEIRALGAVIYDHAVLAVQKPGRTPDFGGRITISIGHTAKLGARIAALLPDCPAGRHPAHSARSAAVRDENEPRPGPAPHRIRRLLSKRHTAEGHIRIEAGLDQPTPAPTLYYTWIDVADDGRYLLRAGEEVYITPANRRQIAEHLHKRIPR
ncbi:MAG: ESX secretion-associated protein EspG [Nocardia sp.]|nr:ESX secretion-associated protein EspG [Nocardia sp.]